MKWRCWITPIKDTQYGWVDLWWQEVQASIKFTTLAHNIMRGVLQFADTMPYFQDDCSYRLLWVRNTKIINRIIHSLIFMLWINPSPFLANARILFLLRFSYFTSCMVGDIVEMVEDLRRASEVELYDCRPYFRLLRPFSMWL